MRRLVFVCAPYAAPTDEETARNVERARLVGALAVRRGLVPIVPHLAGRAGLYGSGVDNGSGEERAAALSVSVAHARAVGAYGGDLWVILLGAHTMSLGCIEEHNAWWSGVYAGGHLPSRVLAMRWSEWRLELEEAGIVVAGTPADDVAAGEGAGAVVPLSGSVPGLPASSSVKP